MSMSADLKAKREQKVPNHQIFVNCHALLRGLRRRYCAIGAFFASHDARRPKPHRSDNPFVRLSPWACGILPWVRRRGVTMGDEGREEGQAIGSAFLSAALAIGLYAAAHFLPAACRGKCPERDRDPPSEPGTKGMIRTTGHVGSAGSFEGASCNNNKIAIMTRYSISRGHPAADVKWPIEVER